MASALVSTRRRAGAASGSMVSEDQGEGALSFLYEFPSSAEIVEDLQLLVLLGRQVLRAFTDIMKFGVLNMKPLCTYARTNFFSISRAWQARRVVYTKEAIAFAQPHADMLLDPVRSHRNRVHGKHE